MATTQKASDFYYACRNGDMDTVKKILPKLKANDINRIESNGSTALHAASYYGHANVVRLLLERGADTTIRNKYKTTAKEEASTDEIRSVFESTTEIQGSNDNGDDDDDEDLPESQFVQIYRIPKGTNESALATRILRARLGTYPAHQYSISASSNLEHLEKKYRQLCEQEGNQMALKKGEGYFKKFRETESFDYIIKLYTDETPFYKIVHNDETYLVEMYKHLLRYDKYNFQGRTYRGASLLFNDLKPYQWAKTHPKSLLEIRKLTSTSTDFGEALRFTGYNRDGYRRVLFEFMFDAPCFSAIDVSALSEFTEQKEVLILSGSFFKVTEILDDENDTNLTTILPQNVRADKTNLLTIN